MNICVVDAGANYVATISMDGASLGNVNISLKKVKTAGFFDRPTGDIGSLSQPGRYLF